MNQVLSTTDSSRRAPAGAILAVLALIGILPACSAQGGAATGEAKTPDAVAEIDGKPVTQAELEELAAPHLKRLEAQRQQILDSMLNQLIEKKLIEAEATARGITAQELEKAEVADKVGEVSDAEVDAFFEENKARIPPDQTKEQVGPQIRTYLAGQRQTETRTAFLADLRQKHKVRILLEPPREKVEVAGAPTKGPDDAPVTIVEFSDFECPYCSRLNPTLDQVVQTYGQRVRIAFRQFPLAMHANAQKAAEASLCAHDQGKFWQMHDAMFSNQRSLAIEQLKAKAVELGLEGEKFDQCLDSGQHADRVAEDFKAGQAAGVTGTPALFINGRMVSGAVPFDQVAQVIDDELARKAGG